MVFNGKGPQGLPSYKCGLFQLNFSWDFHLHILTSELSTISWQKYPVISSKLPQSILATVQFIQHYQINDLSVMAAEIL